MTQWVKGLKKDIPKDNDLGRLKNIQFIQNRIKRQKDIIKKLRKK